MSNNNVKNIAIIGAGPAGCICAYYAKGNNNVTLFEAKSPLHTLLYTGGGRCNLAYAEYDFKELAKNYPRGEKFLYSVFSQFCTSDTQSFFNDIGVETYMQDDLRIFPVSNSAREVREKMLLAIKHCKIKKEKVIEIEKNNDGFIIKTDSNNYAFDKVVIAIGGHAGFKLAADLGHTIIPPKPALTGLITKENFKAIQGVSLKNIEAKASFDLDTVMMTDDILFTHEGISGPLTYKISSYFARANYNKNNPIAIKLNLLNTDYQSFQDLLNQNAKKDLKNMISDFIPKSLAQYILELNDISSDIKCHQVDGKTRDKIISALCTFEINATAPTQDGEVVTSGGVSLDEINPKTMESKLVEGLYFAGEVIDVDGLCGGFNLQNCWSTGYITSG